MTRLTFAVSLFSVVVVVCAPGRIDAQEPPSYRNGDQLDLIGGLEDPRYYETGYFLESEYGRYTRRNDHAHIDFSFGGVNPKAGLFDRLSSRAFEFRMTAVQPLWQGEIPFALHNEWIGEMQIGFAASYNYANYDTKSNVNVVQGANVFRIDDLTTNVWGFGPDARFLFPPTCRGFRFFVGARFEGLGGWANPDPILVAAPNPMNRMLVAQPTAGVGDNEEVWGLRGEWSAGVMWRDDVSLSASFGVSKLRTKVIDDLENNNDFTFWSINVGISTDLIFCGARCAVSKFRR